MCSQWDVRHPKKIQIFKVNDTSDNLWKTATGGTSVVLFSSFQGEGLGSGRAIRPSERAGQGKST